MATKPAGFWVRLMAMIYDTLVLIGIWVFTVVILVTVAGDAVIGAWVQSVLFVECFAFFAFFWLKRGQTVGMLAWRLRIVNDDGRMVTIRQVLLRFIGALFGIVCVFFGYFWIWIDTEKRSWSDLLSNSRVIREIKSR